MQRCFGSGMARTAWMSAVPVVSRTCNASFREARVEPHVEMRSQWRIDALESGQRRDGCDLSALHVQVVATQDVSEKMPLQERIDRRAEHEVSARRRSSHQLRLNLGSELEAALVRGYGARFPAHFIRDAFALPLLDHVDEDVEPIQTAREPRVGVHLNENLFDLVDGPAGIQSFSQRRPQ